MYFATTDVTQNFVTILASNDYQAVPLKLTETAKCGTPIKTDGGKAADGKGAIGILLYDVDITKNPNGAIVVDGIIDYDKAKTAAGDGLTAEVAALAKALPNIIFRNKDGKTYNGAVDAAE